MSDEARDPFPSRLKAARESRGVSQTELSRRTGITPSSLSHFEGGTRKPSFDNLRRLATALEVTTDYLVARVDTPNFVGAGVDELFRDAHNLSGRDLELTKDFIAMLASRNKK